MIKITRGAVYKVRLYAVAGMEHWNEKERKLKVRGLVGYRPVVVLSINDVHATDWGCVTVLPGTGLRRKDGTDKKVASQRYASLISATQSNGLGKDTVFRGDQIRTLDPGWFTSEKIGMLSGGDLDAVIKAAKWCLGFDLSSTR